MVAGALAGMCEATVTCPLDTIKVRLQVLAGSRLHPGRAGAGAGPTIYSTGQLVLAEGGWTSLWRGWGPLVSGVIPKKAIRFGTYEALMGRYRRKDGTVSGTTAFLAGFAAGTMETFLVVTPSELVKTRVQTDQGNSARPAGAISTLRSIVRQEGFLALWTGNLPTWARQSINQAVRFSCVNAVRQRLEALDQNRRKTWHGFAAGAVAGFVAVFVSNPADMVKTQMQRLGATASSGVLATVKRLVSAHGPRVLWSGSTARLLRLVPGQLVTFGMYGVFVDLLAVGHDRWGW